MMEPAHYRASLNGKTDEFPFSDIDKRDMSDIFNKVSPLGNSLLHVAASSGHGHITELMARHCAFLITKKNSQEDTPLHVAARAGKLNTANILVDYAKNIASTSGSDNSLLKMENNKGNTALHEALLALQYSTDTNDEASKTSVDSLVAAARYLVSSDPEMSYSCTNNAGKTPLYLAVESGNNEILEYILSALPQGKINWPEGKSPVHVAIKQKKLDALQLITKKKPDLLLLRDEKENSALHFAASEGYLEGVCHLLENNSDGAFEKNKKGLYPIHLACKNGHCGVIKELLRKWPDPTELLTNKGRNILHAAAKSGKLDAVMCMLREANTDKLVNNMDNDGNTPLHLAVLHGRVSVVYVLLVHGGSMSNLFNNQGLTAYDIALEQYEMPDTKVSGKQNVLGKDRPYDEIITDNEILRASSLKKSKRPDTDIALTTLSIMYSASKIFKKRFNEPVRAPHVRVTPTREENQKSINNLLVVATLIIGASFAAALQMPSSSSKESGGAAPTGSSNINFFSSFYQDQNKASKAFMIFNTSAMNMSVLAALMLCYAQVVASDVASSMVWCLYGIVGLAIYLLCMAFWTAIYIGTDRNIIPSKPLGYLSGFVVLQLIFLIPLLFLPLKLKEASLLYARFCLICVFFERERLFTGQSFRNAKRIVVA